MTFWVILNKKDELKLTAVRHLATLFFPFVKPLGLHEKEGEAHFHESSFGCGFYFLLSLTRVTTSADFQPYCPQLAFCAFGTIKIG